MRGIYKQLHNGPVLSVNSSSYLRIIFILLLHTHIYRLKMGDDAAAAKLQDIFYERQTNPICILHNA